MSIRLSATAILVRETTQGQGFETLLLRRSRQMKFAPGFWVFPGGNVEPSDYAGNTADELS